MTRSVRASSVLHHLTLNTGDVHQSARSEVGQDVIDWLLPMIDAARGDFPKFDMGFDLYRPHDLDIGNRPIDGAAIYRITSSSTTLPYVTCFACWKADMSDAVWEQCLDAYRVLKMFWKPAPDNPPPVPWLAVIPLPTITLLDIERIIQICDMERCLFWALAEGSGSWL